MTMIPSGSLRIQTNMSASTPTYGNYLNTSENCQSEKTTEDETTASCVTNNRAYKSVKAFESKIYKDTPTLNMFGLGLEEIMDGQKDCFSDLEVEWLSAMLELLTSKKTENFAENFVEDLRRKEADKIKDLKKERKVQLKERQAIDQKIQKNFNSKKPNYSKQQHNSINGRTRNAPR